MANQDGAYRLLLLSREIPRRSSGVMAEFDAKWLCYSTQREFAMKRAEAMLEELVRHVRPPAERRTRHGFIKCYREAVIGPYRCHRYGWWVAVPPR